MNKLSVGIVSLGCDKNRIDSEIMLGMLAKKYNIVNDASKAEIIIVNTCAFIEPSKEEAINTIIEMGRYKKKGNCKLLIVTGCLSQRYGKELMKLMPEIDIMLGVNDYDKLEKSIENVLYNKNKILYCNYSDSVINEGKRILTTPNYSAYLRIAEGCNNFCTYCAIPYIRGRYRSRDIDNILKDAENLAKNGVKEIILVAQDTTRYGIDLYGKKVLHKLIRKISQINEIKWIRILYCYPEEITDELINEISENEKVCKYLDIPIQHISSKILKLMGRKSTKDKIIQNVRKLKKYIPEICLRTSIIVGFPGETDEDFKELKDFILDIRFDKLGVFKYSQEEGTPAAKMHDQIDESKKQEREKELMMLQQKISEDINKNKLGKTYEVLVEGFRDSMWYGRTYEMSPDIDGNIYFKCDNELNIGDMVKINVIKNLEYDLIGVVKYESC